ncbi:MAG: DUF2442 domain-containing protein [Candidatus Eremiobacteraeota bacterium]|nr:DUF2442 domain-containing protein [Candidatus Eremiobacteraeota bacterium]
MKTKTKAHVVTTDAEIDAAIAAAKIYEQYRPRAVAAGYRAKDDTIAIKLATGVELAIPRKLLQGLADADPREVAQVAIEDHGSALHWESLDVDHYVPGLIDGVFGTRKWMSEAGKIGGRAKTPAKRAAARKNGRKGGRPRKVAA